MAQRSENHLQRDLDTLAYRRIKEAEDMLRRVREQLAEEVAERVRIEEELRRSQAEFTVLLERVGATLGGVGISAAQPASGSSRDLLEYLRRSKDQLSSILHGIAEGVIVQDRAGELVYANDAAARALGFPSPEALLSALPGDLLKYVEVSDDLGRTLSTSEVFALDDKALGLPLVLRSRDTGDRMVAIARANRVTDERGNLRFLVTLFTDITELKNAQEALVQEYQLAEERVNRLQTMAQGLFAVGLMPFQEASRRVTDVALEVARASHGAFYPFDEERQVFVFPAAATDPQGAVPSPEDIGDLLRPVRNAGAAWEFKHSAYVADCSADGRWRRLLPQVGSFYVVASTFSDRLFGAKVLLSRDRDGFSDEARFMADTVTAYGATVLENARLYQQVQVLAAESERTKISHELHDGLAQVLGYVNAQAQAVEIFLEKGDVAQGKEQLRSLAQAARHAYQDVRQGMMDIRAHNVMERGFFDALEDYLTNFRRRWGEHLELDYQVSPVAAALSPAQEVQVLRIIQEAMANVRKHAQATRLDVRLAPSGSRLVVQIRDNGVGFNPAGVPNTGLPHLGLTTMRERAMALGGRLEIRSVPNEGTTVLLEVPVMASSLVEAPK